MRSSHAVYLARSCGECGHPFSLHGNGTTQCRAMGCAGESGKRCQAFRLPDAPEVPVIQAASA
jgi:hypothetical protein